MVWGVSKNCFMLSWLKGSRVTQQQHAWLKHHHGRQSFKNNGSRSKQVWTCHLLSKRSCGCPVCFPPKIPTHCPENSTSHPILPPFPIVLALQFRTTTLAKPPDSGTQELWVCQKLVAPQVKQFGQTRSCRGLFFCPSHQKKKGVKAWIL